MNIVLLIYGASFIVLGAAILVQPVRVNTFELPRILWLLATFGLIHGANEWLGIWLFIYGPNMAVSTAELVVLLVSFAFLFEFGRRLLLASSHKHRWHAALLGWPVYIIPIGGIATGILIHDNLWNDLNIWGRYLVCFPGALITGLGFLFYYRSERHRLAEFRVRPYFVLATLAFVAYGILSGLVVPEARYFPASALNYNSFLASIHAPVQFFRALCAVVATFALIEIMHVFAKQTGEP